MRGYTVPPGRVEAEDESHFLFSSDNTARNKFIHNYKKLVQYLIDMAENLAE